MKFMNKMVNVSDIHYIDYEDENVIYLFGFTKVNIKGCLRLREVFTTEEEKMARVELLYKQLN